MQGFEAEVIDADKVDLGERLKLACEGVGGACGVELVEHFRGCGKEYGEAETRVAQCPSAWAK